jgi:hypothetical protein
MAWFQTFISTNKERRPPFLLATESLEQCERMRAAYFDEFKPRNPVEEFIVEDMVACRWRLLRMMAIEARVMDWRITGECDALCAAYGFKMGDPELLGFIRRQKSFFRRQHKTCLENLVLMRENRALNGKPAAAR